MLNGWGMLGGGLALLAASALGESWGELAWTAEAIGSIAYLALIGSAVPFVVLTVLLRHISAQAIVVPGDAAAVRGAGLRSHALRRGHHRCGRSAGRSWWRPGC